MRALVMTFSCYGVLETVCAIIIALTITHNDDAGFTSQTAVAPELRTQNRSAV